MNGVIGALIAIPFRWGGFGAKNHTCNKWRASGNIHPKSSHLKGIVMAKISECVVGAVFGQLTVLSLGKGEKGVIVNCLCSCGAAHSVRVSNLGRATKSCGCTTGARISARQTTHGLSKSRAYSAWSNLWKRCTNPSNNRYTHYKTRRPGDRWLKFENFLEDMGEPPVGLSLERVNNELGYSRENCIWASNAVQGRNTSRNVLLSVEGQSLCLSDACELEGKDRVTVRSRLNRGWTPAEALENPKYSWPNGISHYTKQPSP